MPPLTALGTTITLSKFVGTISLGLLTGTTYTISTLTLPPLLALPSAPLALKTLTTLRQKTSTHQRILSSISLSSFLLAYILSPGPEGGHPYLLYAAAAVGAGWGREVWGWGKGVWGRVGNGAAGAGGYSGEEGGSEEEWEVENGGGNGAGEGSVNGEVVREGAVRWGEGMGVRGLVWGVGWVVSVVGVWGDAGWV